jgi:hypothetical protein
MPEYPKSDVDRYIYYINITHLSNKDVKSYYKEISLTISYYTILSL